MTPEELHKALSQRAASAKSGRYSWFAHSRHNFPPYIFHLISDHDRDLLLRWYDETETRWPHGDGASGYTAISTIAGFILGSGVRTMVQCGHYVGFSTILLGMVFRYMGFKNALYSIDLHENATDYASRWVREAGLEEYVKCVVKDSADPVNVDDAINFFDGPIESVYVDSAHTYIQTRRELDLWYRNLTKNGLIFLHDASDFAKTFDRDNQGGVKLALLEYINSQNCQAMLLNSDWPGPKAVFTDPCGLGIVQKV